MMYGDVSAAVTWTDELSSETKYGTILNSAYCPVSGKWFMLVAEEGGRFHNIPADGLETYPMWSVEMMPSDGFWKPGDDDLGDLDDE
jgi:hypothetical protein